MIVVSFQDFIYFKDQSFVLLEITLQTFQKWIQKINKECYNKGYNNYDLICSAYNSNPRNSEV